MKPTQELLHKAKAKAKATFKPNRSNNWQSIRLTADDTSYTLFYLMGATYIGSFTNEPLGKFFKNREVYTLQNKDNKAYANLQRL
jgi:hypothetical protein